MTEQPSSTTPLIACAGAWTWTWLCFLVGHRQRRRLDNRKFWYVCDRCGRTRREP